MNNGATGTGPADWWGDTELTEDRWSLWRIGPLSLYVRCTQAEWHLAWSRGDDPLEDTLAYQTGSQVAPELETMEQARFVFSSDGRTLSMRPLLADRAVIARPEIPVFVPAGHHVALYVSTAIWLQLLVGESPLTEIPVSRPSDTWFGANTREGELSYASITRARTSSTQQAALAHRAVTPVDVINEGTTPLQIEQIRVPVTMLALYRTNQGYLTTDPVSLRRVEGESEATLEVPELPASEGAVRISEPRQQAETGTVVQAFTNLFN